MASRAWEDFVADMRKLGCSDRCAQQMCRLAYRFSVQYSQISLEELLEVVRVAVFRAQGTYKQPSGLERLRTRFSTWLSIISRNALCSYVKQEAKQRERFIPRASPGESIVSSDYVDEEISCHDEMKLLAQVLSPLAWRVFWLQFESSPVVPTKKSLSEELGISVRSVSLLQQEVRESAHTLFTDFSLGLP